MTVKEFKETVYEEYKEEINLISKASKTEDWQADISVATEMFITYVENAETSIFVNMRKAKKHLAELRALIEE